MLPDLKVKPTCSRALSNDTILRLNSSINVRSAPRPRVETHYEPLMTSQTRRVASCHLLLRGNRWMPVSMNKKLGANDRCSPGGAVITAYLSAVVEGDTIVGWMKNSAFIVREVRVD